ncbi:MAG: hypothetical protein GX428_01205 [Candidatus Atribacteria bacterium]|nr:hypothetical protein [Candidatus Atribacteria bacterium]
MAIGKKVWVIPDGELPRKELGKWDSHEAIMILNTNPFEVKVGVSVYFKDQEPVEGIVLQLGAKRMFDFRVDRPEEFGGYAMPAGKAYSLVLRCDHPIVVEYSRLLSLGECFGMFTTIPYFEEEIN